MSYDNLSSVSQNVLKFYQQLTGEERRISFIFDDFYFCRSRVIGLDMTENRIFTLYRMITWVVFLRIFSNFISSLPVKRGGSLSFLVGTISNVLVMEIGWTDVGSGGISLWAVLTVILVGFLPIVYQIKKIVIYHTDITTKVRYCMNKTNERTNINEYIMHALLVFVFCSQILLNHLAFQVFHVEPTWWRLLQKRIVMPVVPKSFKNRRNETH
jgi:hypothetical protein